MMKTSSQNIANDENIFTSKLLIYFTKCFMLFSKICFHSAKSKFKNDMYSFFFLEFKLSFHRELDRGMIKNKSILTHMAHLIKNHDILKNLFIFFPEYLPKITPKLKSDLFYCIPLEVYPWYSCYHVYNTVHNWTIEINFTDIICSMSQDIYSSKSSTTCV